MPTALYVDRQQFKSITPKVGRPNFSKTKQWILHLCAEFHCFDLPFLFLISGITTFKIVACFNPVVCPIAKVVIFYIRAMVKMGGSVVALSFRTISVTIRYAILHFFCSETACGSVHRFSPRCFSSYSNKSSFRASCSQGLWWACDLLRSPL